LAAVDKPVTKFGVSSAAVSLAFTIAENVVRVGAVALLFFCPLHLKKRYSSFAIVDMALALLVYYSAWMRFFLRGGGDDLLSAPLAGIPSALRA
jgi:hypothetical protein